MLVQSSASLGDLTSATSGTAVFCPNMGADGLVTISGTFVGTVVVDISLDGTNFAPTGSSLTAPGTVVLPRVAKKVRTRCTAYTSGTITGVAGFLGDL